MLALALVLVLTGCSGDDGDEGAAAPATVAIEIPDAVDEVCEDVLGDVADDEFVLGTSSEPAGVDLLRAEAHLDEERLDVVWTVAGDPAAAVDARYTVTQGRPGDPTSWTLSVEAGEDGWDVVLFTTEQVDDPRGIVLTQEVPSVLDARPEVAPTADGGATVALSLPRAAVPPPATIAWLFGASAAPVGEQAAPVAPPGTTAEGAEVEAPEPDDVFDDCSNLFDATG